tara:strand:- start:1022 stop:3163 length:2142 start_codon:yes stop_codon:yes gene_type:complete
MAFGSEIKLSNIQENWLFEFAYNSGTLYLSMADYNDNTNQYHGAVLNKPTIRESLDLAASKANSANISLTVANFNYKGNLLSEFLFGGSNYFINREVTVKSQVNDTTPEVIGYFRVNDMMQNEDTIQFLLVAHRIWDYIDLPIDKTLKNEYVPIVYGNYTKNSNTSIIDSESPTYSSAVFTTSITGNDYFPAPYYRSAGGKEEMTTGIHSIDPNAELAFYDSAFDKFIPFTDPTSANVVRTTNHYISKSKKHFARGFGHRPNDHTDHHGKWTDEAKAYNTDTGDYAEYSFTFTASASNPNITEQNTANDIDYSFTIPAGKLNKGKMVFEIVTFHALTDFNPSADTYEVKVFIDYTGTGDSFEEVISEDNGDLGFNNHTGANAITKAFTYDDRHPDTIKIGIYRRVVDDVGAGGSNPVVAQTIVRINDIKMYPEMINEEKDGLTGYCAGDGLTNSWDSSAITEIHEAHRDMLIRFAGMATTTPTNWSTLDSTKNWGIRYWQTKLQSLKSILEKLQYEGGFIFKFKRGKVAEPEYIYIKDSYSSGDINYTITKDDISKAEIKITDFGDLVSKMNVNYDLHPSGGRYITKKTAFSNTVRTNYNIQSKENIVDVNLDAYISPDVTEYDNSTAVESANPNDDFFAYYHNIIGTPRVIVKGVIVNPAFYDIDTGDLVQFSDMYPEKAFGKAYTDLVFMITLLQRTAGTLQFEAREIGEI